MFDEILDELESISRELIGHDSGITISTKERIDHLIHVIKLQRNPAEAIHAGFPDDDRE